MYFLEIAVYLKLVTSCKLSKYMCNLIHRIDFIFLYLLGNLFRGVLLQAIVDSSYVSTFSKRAFLFSSTSDFVAAMQSCVSTLLSVGTYCCWVAREASDIIDTIANNFFISFLLGD